MKKILGLIGFAYLQLVGYGSATAAGQSALQCTKLLNMPELFEADRLMADTRNRRTLLETEHRRLSEIVRDEERQRDEAARRRSIAGQSSQDSLRAPTQAEIDLKNVETALVSVVSYQRAASSRLRAAQSFEVICEGLSDPNIEARLYNVDDIATVMVNGVRVLQLRFEASSASSASAYLWNHLRPGVNKVEFVLKNVSAYYTWAFELRSGQRGIYLDTLGTAGSLAANYNDDAVGEVIRQVIYINRQ